MDPAVGTLIGGIIIAVITFIISPWIKSVLDRQKENDPVLGWKTAVDEVKQQATKLAERVSNLEAEISRLEDDNAVKTSIIARLDMATIEQSHMLSARDTRIAQLEGLWRAAMGGPPPPPDPAIVYWLVRPAIGKVTAHEQRA